MEARAVAAVTDRPAAFETEALRDTPHAFDGVATTYDRSNRENPLLCAMRDRTRAALERAAPPGSRILDLGCGPGTDVVYFAAKGYRVTAIDWSTAMVDEAQRRVRAECSGADVSVWHLGIEQLDTLPSRAAEPFDAAYSSFGPLNCVIDLDRAARSLAARMRPGGVLVASVIGRVCPWEIALYTARRNFRRALIRFSRGPVPVPLEGRTIWTRYYSPRSFTRVFERAGFEAESLRALGLLTPPPYLDAFAERHPQAIARLQALEDAIGGWPVVRGSGDHFLISMRRRRRE